MVTKSRRERSPTTQSTDFRPASRASTESIRQAPPQHHRPGSIQHTHSFHGFTSEEHALAHHLGNPGAMMVDHSMHYAHPQEMAMQNGHPGYGHMPGQFEMQYSAPIAAASGAETDDKRRRGPAATANNDKELRELLRKNDARSLQDVAHEVIATERTSKAEKTKQLFAMLWLRAVCRSSKSSVPRSRVYSSYAERCATERVQPLNPASFGKLVRVIFPGIQTRRLGVRGESKYHYVDLALLDDSDQRSNEVEAAQAKAAAATVPPTPDFGTMPRFPADTTVFSVEEPIFPSNQPVLPTGPASRGTLFTNPYSMGLQQPGQLTSHSYQQTLKFPPIDPEPSNENEPIELPNIYDYAPPKTDVDAADALTALYRTHCTSLVDCIRFCKEKQFFRLFTTFHGTLTVPVQKLLVHPDITPWIKECDWLMYQKMLRFVSRLTLQVVPHIVLNFLTSISRNLHNHLSKTFQNLPQRVLEAKLEPATLFAGLLHRLLRVNSAAHAAANLLTIDAHRNQMWEEWVQFVNPVRIIESELPNCGYEQSYKILTHDVRSLLEPLVVTPYLEQGTHYQDAAIAAASNGLDASINNETVIDRIAAFLTALPTRFPEADTRTILHCVSAIGTAALREITVENGPSFGAWWVTKTFVDEMALWLASLGGFLGHTPAPVEKRSEESVEAAATASTVPNGTDRQFNQADGPLAKPPARPEPSLGTFLGSANRSASVPAQQHIQSHPGQHDNSQLRHLHQQHQRHQPLQQQSQQQRNAFSAVNNFNGATSTQPHQSQHTSFDQSGVYSQEGFVDPKPYEDANLDDSGIGMMLDEHFDAKTFEALGVPAGQTVPQHHFQQNLNAHQVQ